MLFDGFADNPRQTVFGSQRQTGFYVVHNHHTAHARTQFIVFILAGNVFREVFRLGDFADIMEERGHPGRNRIEMNLFGGRLDQGRYRQAVVECAGSFAAKFHQQRMIVVEHQQRHIRTHPEKYFQHEQRQQRQRCRQKSVDSGHAQSPQDFLPAGTVDKRQDNRRTDHDERSDHCKHGAHEKRPIVIRVAHRQRSNPAQEHPADGTIELVADHHRRHGGDKKSHIQGNPESHRHRQQRRAETGRQRQPDQVRRNIPDAAGHVKNLAHDIVQRNRNDNDPDAQHHAAVVPNHFRMNMIQVDHHKHHQQQTPVNDIDHMHERTGFENLTVVIQVVRLDNLHDLRSDDVVTVHNDLIFRDFLLNRLDLGANLLLNLPSTAVRAFQVSLFSKNFFHDGHQRPSCFRKFTDRDIRIIFRQLHNEPQGRFVGIRQFSDGPLLFASEFIHQPDFLLRRQ